MVEVSRIEAVSNGNRSTRYIVRGKNKEVIESVKDWLGGEVKL